MSVATIKNEVKIIENGEPITVELEFKTLLLCTYRIQVKEPDSNKIIYDLSGDNTNEEDDKYELGSGKENIGRTIWISLTIIDQTDEGGDYEIKVFFERDHQQIVSGVMTTGEKRLLPKTNKADYLFVARLIK